MPGYRMGTTSGGERNGHWRALLACLVLVLTLGVIPAAAWALPAGSPPTQDTAAGGTTPGQVVAQGITRLPRGDLAWTVRRIDVSGEEGIAVESFPVGFALADAGTVAVLDEDGAALSLLGEGEAALLPVGRGALAGQSDGAASLYEIALVSNRDIESGQVQGTVVGNPFAAPNGGAFDLELSQATLENGQAATIPVSRSTTPVLFVQRAGSVRLTAADGQSVELAAGQFALLAGEVQVSGASAEPATFVVAAIGEATAARDAAAAGTPRARGDRGDRQRVRDGSGSAQGDDAPRTRRTREGRTPRVRTGGGGRSGGGGGGGTQSQQQTPGGAPSNGGAGATATPGGTSGTPPVEPTAPATQPPATPPPGDGTPPPDATTPPTGETPTAAPTETIPAGETPTVPVEPTVPLVPTNPPVPPNPEVPTVPAEEPAAEATLPVEEAPAAEETPAA